MKRIILIVIVSLCCCGPFTALSQTPRPDAAEVLKQLLALPAPRPATRTAEESNVMVRPESFFDRNNPPPDDAPTEDLIAYWARAMNYGREPTDVVRQRLLEGCLSDPDLLARFIHLLPTTEAAAEKIKEVYDKVERDENPSGFVREQLKNWLVYHSKFFLDELLALVRKIKENEKNGDVDNSDALAALARLAWDDAEPILRSFANSARPRSAAFAQSVFYEHAVAEKDSAAEERYRNTLKAITVDRNQPAYARNVAIQSLSNTEWSGRDDWYLHLLEDETLLHLSDGSDSFSPLTTLCFSDSNKWIPIMARLVESKDMAIRSAAAQCLIGIPGQDTRRDALLPLLPWLTDRAWVRDDFDNRVRLIHSLSTVDVPESVPGLISVLENAEFTPLNFERSYAAISLARYKDPRAVPALKKALAKEKDEYSRNCFIQALIACQGISDTEQLEALETYAAQLTTAEGRAEAERYRTTREEPLPPTLAIGKYLAKLSVAPDSFVQAVLLRAENLKADNPALAHALIEIAHHWQGHQVELDMIMRIGNGTADTQTITEALKRREQLQQNLRSELQGLAAVSGTGQGVGAVLLADQTLAHGVLDSQDQIAQVALLACSRLARMSLPLELVGPLLRSKNSLLALVAERYLLIEDSKEAQELLWQVHPNKAFMTGWGENGEYVYTYEQIAKLEEKLRAELFKENGPTEIIALLIESDSNNRVLRIFPDKAVYTEYEDPARYRERVITPAEASSFKQFLTTKNLPDSGPQFGWCHHNCRSEVFVKLTKEKGRRVYSEQGFEIWTDLRDTFDHLGEGAKLHYNLETQLKGLEVLYADKTAVVKDVWQRGGEIRIFVEREPPEEEETPDNESDEDDESEAALMEQWRKEVVREKARTSWHVYANNKAGAQIAPPEIFSTIDVSKFPPDEESSSVLEVDLQVQKLTPDSIIIARNMEGLWKQLSGTKAVQVGSADAAYANPVVTPDGKWVVVSKTDDDWNTPNYVVRFNSRTGREFRVNLEPADEFEAIAFVPSHGKVLLRRARDGDQRKPVGPERPEYYLLDPTTGETRLVTGEFAPLRQKGQRFLQPADQPNEYWAAIPDDEKNQTQVGRHNVKDFTFKQVLLIPHINFDSMAMWVDASQKKIYLVYNCQLLRLPLP